MADGHGASNSDVPMAADSDEYSKDGSAYVPAMALLHDFDKTEESLSRKRKSATSHGPGEHGEAKRARLAAADEESLPRDRAQQLPAEIWQHILTLLDPRALGALLSVNKLFHTYLHTFPRVKASYPPVSSPPVLPLLKPDAIWQASRRHHWPRMPVPLKTRSELDMWRIACSRSCQFCKTRESSDTGAADDQWHHGPGAKGVSPVFPFFLVSCGRCLSEKSLKEVDVLLSPSIPTALLPGVPFVFLTPDLHVISPQTISSGGAPQTGRITKVYWPEQIEGIKRELQTVKELGTAAAEEWLKGLEVRGKHALVDASRWEKWYHSGNVHRMRQPLPPVLPPAERENPSVSAHLTEQEPGYVLQESLGIEHAANERVSSRLNGSSAEIPRVPAETQARAQGQLKRTKEEVSELKAKRRSEIERRAMLLEPPLSASVLAHIPSFQAALQIITPLDDNAWELLKPRLLAQREAAQQKEVENIANTKALQARTDPGPAKAEVDAKQPNQVPDEVWDEVQGPVRARISGYADEIVRDGWGGGKKVGKKTTSQFAAEVLVYVRKRFYAEVAKDAAAAVASGKEPVTDPPQGPWTQKLTLENMKWVFDMKIKRYTERHRKDLFLCGACTGGTNKLYGFEGVIQHYAAKHTNSLSAGNAVVFWRAEWPDEPIFNPDPKQVLYPQSANSKGPQPPPSTAQTPYDYAPSPVASYPPQNGSYGYPPQTLYPTSTAYRQGMPDGVPQGGGYAPPQLLEQNGGYPPYSQAPPLEAQLQHGEQITHVQNAPVPASNQNHRRSCTPTASSHLYKIRLNLMAKIAQDTWTKISHVKRISGAVRASVMIHHVAKAFQDEFSEAAPLAMFIDGLSNRKEMRPLRQASQLVCKACSTASGSDAEAWTYSLPQLANHFKSIHVEGAHSQGLAPLDWRVDMILLPDMRPNHLSAVIGKGKRAKKLVRDALPWAFENDGAKTKTPTQQRAAPSDGLSAFDGPAEEEEDDHYSPPLSIGPENGRQVMDGPAEGDRAAQNAPSGSPREPSQPLPQAGAPARVLERTQPPGFVPRSSERPNLIPASVVYNGAESRRPYRPRPSKPPHDQRTKRPVEPLERPEPLARPRVGEEGSEVYAAGPRPTESYPVERGHGKSWVVYAEREIHPRDANPREAYEPWPRREHDGNQQRGRIEATPAPAMTVPSRQLDGEYGSLHTSETRLEPRPQEFHAEPRHVTRQGTVAPDYAPYPVSYVDGRTHVASGRRRSVSPPHEAGDPYASGHYRERSPARVYGRRPYGGEEAYPAYPPHPDELPPRRAPPPPAGAYEVVEVRDPQGSYFIKRPIRRDPPDVYAYDARPAPRDFEPPRRRVPPPEDAHPVAPRPAAAVYDDAPPRPVGEMRRQRSRQDLEEYDPRFPAAGARAVSRPPPRY